MTHSHTHDLYARVTAHWYEYVISQISLHPYVREVTFIHATWLIHSYDTFICVTWYISVRAPMCVRERERKRERERESRSSVCVCVWERETERECVCMYIVCAYEYIFTLYAHTHTHMYICTSTTCAYVHQLRLVYIYVYVHTGAWCTIMCATSRSSTRRDSFIATTHSYLWHDTFISVRCGSCIRVMRIWMCHVTNMNVLHFWERATSHMLSWPLAHKDVGIFLKCHINISALWFMHTSRAYVNVSMSKIRMCRMYVNESRRTYEMASCVRRDSFT